MILSVTQVERFDHSQYGGCGLRWWYESVMGLRPEQTDAQSDGDKGHALFARYFLTGEIPKGRVKMGKAVTGAILKGDLPQPGQDLQVERRFSGQPKFDESTCQCGHGPEVHANNACAASSPDCDCSEFRPRWAELDVDRTLWLGGMPWEGFIDLAYRRDAHVTVLDHKFHSDLGNAKSGDALIQTVQLPVYCLNALRTWPDATSFRIAHNNVSKRGVQSVLRERTVSLGQILERKAAVEQTVKQMQAVATVTDQMDVPYSKKACEAYGGCPHQSICPRFKEKPKVNLTPEEMALFDDLAPARDQIPESTPEKPIPSRTPATDPGLPPPAGKRLQIVDIPPGGVEAGNCDQGKLYQVGKVRARFTCRTVTGGKTLASFMPETGGIPVLMGLGEYVVPIADGAEAPTASVPPQPTPEVKPEPKTRRARKSEEKATQADPTPPPPAEPVSATPVSPPAQASAPTSSVALGDRVMDCVTGFSGIVTGRVDYLTGCGQYLVQPQIKDGGDFVEARWFDETRIVQVQGGAVALPPRTDSGPDLAAPIK